MASSKLGIVFGDEQLPQDCKRAGRDVEGERNMLARTFDGNNTVQYTDAPFDEYAQLWARYMRLSVDVIKRNQYVIVGPNDKKVIPRIQDLIDKETDQDRIDELEAYEAYHIRVWEQMEALIDDICKNEYVKRRTHQDKREMRAFRQGLYDQIRD